MALYLLCSSSGVSIRLRYFLTTGAQLTEFSRKFLLRTLDMEPTAVALPTSVVDKTSESGKLIFFSTFPTCSMCLIFPGCLTYL